MKSRPLANAQVGYAIALVELKRALGTLLQSEQVDYVRASIDGVPTLLLEKPPLIEELPSAD